MSTNSTANLPLINLGKEHTVARDCIHKCLVHLCYFQWLEFVLEVELIPSDFYLGDNTLLVSPGESESNTAVNVCFMS